MIQWSSSNSEEKWSGGPNRSLARALVTEKHGCALAAVLTEETPPTGLSGVSHKPLCVPPALGGPPRLYPQPQHTHRECGLVCFFHVSESRDRLHEPRCTDLGRLWRPPAPAGQELAASRLFTEATAQQCPPPRAQEGAGGRGRGRGGRAGGALRPGRYFTLRLPGPAGRGRRPSRVFGPTCVATRRGAGLGRPLGPRGTSLPRGRTDRDGEGGSSRACESGARAARPPSWAGDRCVTRGAGSPRAEAGAGSGRGAPSGEWGLAAA